jgi:alkanesulfonate monooxygenase SsuD/methylene tetrahydromethanopterin reductase-like flavin-dependent oxidoreductase (luciferase family)
VDDNVVQPRPTVYAGGDSEAAEELIAAKCDGYLMHGDSPARVAEKIADMRQRKERHGLPPMLFGVAGYTPCRYVLAHLSTHTPADTCGAVNDFYPAFFRSPMVSPLPTRHQTGIQTP